MSQKQSHQKSGCQVQGRFPHSQSLPSIASPFLILTRQHHSSSNPILTEGPNHTPANHLTPVDRPGTRTSTSSSSSICISFSKHASFLASSTVSLLAYFESPPNTSPEGNTIGRCHPCLKSEAVPGCHSAVHMLFIGPAPERTIHERFWFISLRVVLRTDFLS